MTSESARSPLQEVAKGAAQDLSALWWWFLALGIVWILFGAFVLSYRVGSVLAVAVLVGVGFLWGGVTQFVVASQVQEWKWLFIAMGILSIAAGIVAFVWPDITLYIVSIFLAWYLIVFGILHVVMGLAGPKVQWWWTELVLGISELVLGVWAVRSYTRSLLTMLTLVGVWAIFVGVREIFVAFTLRDAKQGLEQFAS
jgi:uncharacterized membrane protein HdeD (DUF308 family)